MRRFAVVGLMCLGIAAFCQTAAAPAFEVASIKPSAAEFGSYMRYLPGGRFSGMSWMKQVIQYAYGVEDYQVTGGPGWLTTDRYAIEAKASSTDATKSEMNAMLQTLLADRFKLHLRRGTKEFDVYYLVVDKGGPKLTPLKDGQASKCGRDNSVICGMQTTGQLAAYLKYSAGRPVIDKTGLDGKYDVLLDFDTYAASGRTPPEGYDKPSLTTALKDQLGLRLEPAKEQLPLLTVESIERPSEN